MYFCHFSPFISQIVVQTGVYTWHKLHPPKYAITYSNNFGSEAIAYMVLILMDMKTLEMARHNVHGQM